MDIKGAKALRERLGSNAGGDSPPASDAIPEDAPPIFHWTGVSQAPSDTHPADVDDDPAVSATALFRRLGLSFR